MRFGYAFQIEFQLSGISGLEVKLVRRVTHKTHYVQRGMVTAAQVREVMQKKPLRLADPRTSEDSPNEGNVKREASRVVVQDGPGPSFGIHDQSMYPMAFEGKFILMLQTKTGALLASVEYYVCLEKAAYNAPSIAAHFEALRQTIVPAPPPPPPVRKL